MAPFTDEVPKPLMPVAGVPIVEHVFALLGRHGFRRAYVNAHHLGGQLVDAYEGEGSFDGLGVTVVLEPDLSGTAGGMKRLAGTAEGFGEAFDGTFLVIMGDALTDVDLSGVVAYHKEMEALATVALVGVDDTTGYGVVEVDGAGFVKGFQEKPDPARARSRLANTGIYVFEPGVLDYVPSGRAYDFAHDVFPRLLAQGERFAAYDASGAYWSDVGTLGAYKGAHKDALLGRVRGLKQPGTAWGVGGPRIGHGARLHPAAHARIVGSCVVGAGAEVGCVASISGCVAIGEACRVDAGAVVKGSVLLPGAIVGEGARVEDCIVGPGFRVPAGERFVGGCLSRLAPEGKFGAAGPSRARRERQTPIAV